VRNASNLLAAGTITILRAYRIRCAIFAMNIKILDTCKHNLLYCIIKKNTSSGLVCSYANPAISQKLRLTVLVAIHLLLHYFTLSPSKKNVKTDPGAHPASRKMGRLRLKCDGTRAETTFGLSAKRTSPFKSAVGASVQSTTGSRGVRISGSNAGYTMLRGSVKTTGYSLHSPVSPSLPLPCVTVYQHISTGLYPQSSRQPTPKDPNL